MTPKTRYALIAAFLATAAAGDGFATGRWSGRDPDYSIPAVPMQFGPWKAEAMPSGVSEPKVVNVTRCYTHSQSGRRFTVSLSNGPPGLTGVHTPEYCYAGSGFEMVEAKARRGVTGTPAQLFGAVFRKGTGPQAETQRLLWAWAADGQWTAPSMPRMASLGKPNLYKLYVVSTDPTPNDPDLDSFLRDLLAELDARLFSAAKAG